MATDEQLRKEIPEEVVAAGAVVNVTEYLKGTKFPATRADLEHIARANGADESAMEELKKLPPDRTFGDPSEIIAAIGDEVKGL